MPYLVVGQKAGRVPLKGQVHRTGMATQQPPCLAQPRLVGHEGKQDAGLGLLRVQEASNPVGEGCPSPQ